MPAAWSTSDDLIEAVQDPDRSFTLGVHWHPEELPDGRLSEALVAAGRANAG